MSRLRFATAGDLFDSFPTAATDIGVTEPREFRSTDFLRFLTGRGDFRAALSFCAYLLARREAVWWGCQAVRESGDLCGDEKAMIEAAESWVRTPEEDRRRYALDLAQGSDTDLAGRWICLGAGWAGGSIPVDAQRSVPVAPQSTAQAVRVGMILAAGRLEGEDRGPVLRRWVEAGITLAEAGTQRSTA